MQSFRRKCLATFLLVPVSFVGLVWTQSTNKFPYKETEMPFNAKAVERPIDRDCSDSGKVSPTLKNRAAQEEQNRAKNNFRAAGAAVSIQVADFDRLERASLKARNCWFNKRSNCQKLELSDKIPVDRQQLLNITKTESGDQVGEGTIVTLEAKIMDSHYSNTKYNKYPGGKTGNGESVNCKNLEGVDSSQIDRNDIHIVLVMPGEKRPCYSVTAEISPHFRPESWRRFHNMGGAVNNEAKGVDFRKVELVRLTGPLFYDASHEPCTPTSSSIPARRSIWEIHPVYQIDVKVGGQWMSFDNWAKTQ